MSNNKRLALIILLVIVVGASLMYGCDSVTNTQHEQEKAVNSKDHVEEVTEEAETAKEEEETTKAEEEWNKKGGVVYVVPNMEKVEVKKDIVYKVDSEKELKLDVYYPLNNTKGTKNHTVILIHGSTPDENFKDRKYLCSWGRLVAASGYTAVTFNWRASMTPTPQDVSDLMKYAREHSDELGINKESVSVVAFSLGVEEGIKQALSVNTGFIKSVVAYYGKMPTSIFDDGGTEKLPPIFIAKAAKDSVIPSDANDEFIQKAKKLNVDVTEIVHTQGRHGFDVFNDDEKSCEIIKESLYFIESTVEIK